MILEDEEYFEISVIRLVLPFGVEAGNPAKIFINDNDSKCNYNITLCNIMFGNYYISSLTHIQLRII